MSPNEHVWDLGGRRLARDPRLEASKDDRVVLHDGSNRTDYGGYGVVMEDNMRSYPLDNSCSIFTAEATPLYRAFQLIHPKTPGK
ncbi:hypothetical protein TNCV_1597931 [Trichonephila clavipes]|nr:hypothetical protein TNCV_1597931 [Trichonephila clavipes]